MEFEEFSENFSLEIKKELNLDNTIADLNANELPEVSRKIFDYMQTLLDWNTRMNLTAITNEKDIIVKHFIDSLTINKYLKNNSNMIDVGTGAGFPGIPVAILRTDMQITLLDSLNKRINFLNEVINKENLKNVVTVHGRAEDLGIDKSFREKYDVAVSRAVAPFNVLIEYLLPFVKVGGMCICMKGPNYKEEIDVSDNALKILGGKIVKTESIVLDENERTIIIVEKVKNTPGLYPRKAGTPSKMPL